MDLIHLFFFSRLVENIRLTDGSSTGMLNKAWDFDIEEKDAEFRDDLREASGIGRRRRKVNLDPYFKHCAEHVVPDCPPFWPSFVRGSAQSDWRRKCRICR